MIQRPASCDRDASFIYSGSWNAHQNKNELSCKYVCQYSMKAMAYSLLALLFTSILILIPLQCNPNDITKKVNFWLYFFVFNLWFSFGNIIGFFYCFYGAIPGVSKCELTVLWIFEQAVTVLMGIIIYYYPLLQSFSSMLRIYNVWSAFIITAAFFAYKSVQLKRLSPNVHPHHTSLLPTPSIRNEFVHNEPVLAEEFATAFDPTSNTRRRKLQIYRSPALQYIYCLAFAMGVSATFQFCQLFTQYFSSLYANDTNIVIHWMSFVVFVVGFYIMKSVLKTIGFRIDMGKSGGSIFYFQGELVSMLYYYVFYRLLFTEVHSYLLFCLLKLVHIGSEWIFYGFRATQCYVRFVNDSTSLCATEYTQRILFSRCLAEFSNGEDDTDIQRKWASLLCLDFGLKLIVMTTTMFGFVCNTLLLRYGYNASVYNYFGSMNDTELQRILIFMSLSLLIEAASAFVMEHFWWKHKFKLSVLLRLNELLNNPYFRIFFINCVAAISCDVFVAEINIQQGFDFSTNFSKYCFIK
eukprot:298330_1